MIYTTFQDWDKTKTETICNGYKKISYNESSQQVYFYGGTLSYALKSISSFVYNNFILISDLTDDTYYYAKLKQAIPSLDITYKFPKTIAYTISNELYYTNSIGTKYTTYYDEKLQISQNITSIGFINNIRYDDVNLKYYKSNQYTIQDNLIISNSVAIGVYIPNINSILLLNDSDELSDDDIVTYQYRFPLISYQYDCRLLPGLYNRTNNITAYTQSNVTSSDYNMANITTYSVQIYTPYITTIGLYNDNNELLAIGKLSQPIKKSNIVQQSVIIQLEYIP